MSKREPNTAVIPPELNPAGYQNLNEMLADVCQCYADRPAFSCLGHSISYRELDELSAAFAAYLQQATDLQPGDRIAIQLPNLLQYPVALYGALRAGLIVVNTNPLYTPREMLHQFRDSGARAILLFQCAAHHLETILAETDIQHVFLTRLGDMHPFPKAPLINAAVKYVKKLEPDFSLPQAVSFVSILRQYRGRVPAPVKLTLHDIAALQYTGGTTGVSRGAMLTHANLLANLQQTLLRIRVTGEDWNRQVIIPLPLYHIYAFTISQAMLQSGGHAVLIPNPRDIPGFVKMLRKTRPTAFLGLNTLFVALCHHPDFKRIDFSRLQLTASGGVALVNETAKQWQAITGCAVIEGYGLTEASPVVSISPPGQEQLGTIGLPVMHTDIRIVDLEGVPVAAGEAGELCVRGPQVMAGYWQNAEATRATMTVDGYLKTGDIALQQPDGYLKIVDRAKDMILVSGFNVYPNEVEEIAYSHPDIRECAAIAEPDPVSGEKVKLFVVSNNPELTIQQVRTWCRQNLAAYKVPSLVVFVDELPKSNVGKILRRELRNLAPART